jgi:hypothetical protein
MRSAQAQYYVHRQLTNPAAMSEATTVAAALYGQYRLYGFDGAPREMALQVTVPFSMGSSRGSYYFSGGDGGEAYSMFFGAGAYGLSAGAYSAYSAALSYAYQVRLTAQAQLAFGVALGASVSGRSYGGLQDYGVDPSLQAAATSLWQLCSQAGVYLHGDRYYASAYSPAIMSELLFLQAGYRAAVGRSDEGGYYGEAPQKKSSWEVHAQAGGKMGGEVVIQGSALYTANGLIGAGVAWQNPLNLAALAQLSIGGVKICYAYQVTDLNANILQHELMLKFSFAGKQEATAAQGIFERLEG